MKEPTYRQAILHGWQLAKEHKLLWMFGLFATFVGQMGLLDLVVQLKLTEQHYTLYPMLSRLGENAVFIAKWFGSAGLSIPSILWLLWIGIFILGAWLMLVFVSISSQGALIHSVGQYVKSRRKEKHVDMDVAWHAGTGHFWRLLLLQIFKKFAILISVSLVGLSAMSLALYGSEGNTLLFIISIVFAIIVGAIASLLVIYAAGYIVIEEMNIHDALESAWKLFRGHWFVSLEVAVVLLAVNIVAAAIGVLLTAIFVGEVAMLWAAALVISSSFFWHAGLALSAFLLVLCLVLIGTLLTVFTTAVWTYLFMVMHKTGIKSRIFHALRIPL